MGTIDEVEGGRRKMCARSLETCLWRHVGVIIINIANVIIIIIAMSRNCSVLIIIITIIALIT